MTATILVLAKAPVPGRVKTRLCPPCSPQEAADLAKAALLDTLHAAASVAGAGVTLVLDGEAGGGLPEGTVVRRQASGRLDERIAAALDEAPGPALLIGMDTPQVTPALLEGALEELDGPDVEAVLGPASDGGWWALGMRDPDGAAVRGTPMSVHYTFEAQCRRLADLGLRVTLLEELRDVDRPMDALAVAEAAPGTRFAALVRELPVLGAA